MNSFKRLDCANRHIPSTRERLIPLLCVFSLMQLRTGPSMLFRLAKTRLSRVAQVVLKEGPKKGYMVCSFCRSLLEMWLNCHMKEACESIKRKWEQRQLFKMCVVQFWTLVYNFAHESAFSHFDLGARHDEDDQNKEKEAKEVVELVLPDGWPQILLHLRHGQIWRLPFSASL